MPMLEGIKKVMMIGSGPIVIGQAAEFDYAGTQACRVLKAAGLEVVLVNSNPATIMTDRANADEIYLEPLTLETIRRIIEKERPDGLLAGFGGQTGLTVSSQLAKEGFLDRMGVHILGTPAEAIDRAEDRELFKETMEAIGQPLIPSATATDVEHALEIAEKIGYPVIVRPAFTLGGAGGGVEVARLAGGFGQFGQEGQGGGVDHRVVGGGPLMVSPVVAEGLAAVAVVAGGPPAGGGETVDQEIGVASRGVDGTVVAGVETKLEEGEGGFAGDFGADAVFVSAVEVDGLAGGSVVVFVPAGRLVASHGVDHEA